MGPTATMTVGAAAAGGLGLLALAGAARRRSGSPVRLRDLVVPFAAVGLVLAVTAAVVLGRGVDSRSFAVVHVAYLGLVVSVPAVGLLLALLAVRTRAGPAVVAAAALLVVPAPVGWFATHWAPHAVRVDRATLVLDPDRTGRDPLRVGVVADVQTAAVGATERRAVRLLQAERPDLILVVGDVFQGNEQQFEAALPGFRDLLGSLDAPGGVFAVRGDSDTGDRLDRLVVGTGIEILDNRVVHLRIGDRRVALGGNPLLWANEPAVAMRAELDASDPAEIRIYASHRPDAVLLMAPTPADLVVAGHTHGGQVALPWWGPVQDFSSVPRRVAAGGLHEVDGRAIYVSTGIGVVRQQAPQVRFGTRPSVGLVTLR